MRYHVQLDPTAASSPLVVDVTELPSGSLDVTSGGRSVDVDVVPVGGTLSVRVDGRVVDLTLEGQPPTVGVVASGRRAYVHVESERQRAASAARGAGGGSTEKLVKAPMPGRVVRLLVEAGSRVAAGQTFCVVEAMKMENEVKAKAACVVAAVHVAEGAAVEGGAKLLTLA